MTNKPASVPDGLADLHCTCYRVRKASRRITGLYDSALAPTGLTVTQFSILAMIATSGPQSMSTLAEALGMDASTLTRTLKPLIDRREVSIIGGKDKRVKQVALTDCGKETVGLAVPYWRAAQKRVERALGGEIAILHSLLRKVSAAAKADEAEAFAIPAART